MMLKQLEKLFIGKLRLIYNEEEAKQLFYLSAEHISGLRKSQIMTSTAEINPEATASYEQVLDALEHGRPLQYILGEAWFYDLKFRVNEAVLIPRPETEELVHWIIETAAGKNLQHLIDIGTGSGCIAITLKTRLPEIQTDALDISAHAIAVAMENAASNKAEVNFIQSDILGYEGITTYDLIVSNPPYIRELERTDMHRNVLDHEPELALFVSDEDPLVFYKSIADFALRYLKPSGYLFFEINEYLGKETVDMLSAKGFINIELRNDMQGKNRMIRCNKSSVSGMEANQHTL